MTPVRFYRRICWLVGGCFAALLLCAFFLWIQTRMMVNSLPAAAPSTERGT